jgi:hypothetical protein
VTPINQPTKRNPTKSVSQALAPPDPAGHHIQPHLLPPPPRRSPLLTRASPMAKNTTNFTIFFTSLLFFLISGTMRATELLGLLYFSLICMVVLFSWGNSKAIWWSGRGVSGRRRPVHRYGGTPLYSIKPRAVHTSKLRGTPEHGSALLFIELLSYFAVRPRISIHRFRSILLYFGDSLYLLLVPWAGRMPWPHGTGTSGLWLRRRRTICHDSAFPPLLGANVRAASASIE